MPPIASPSFVDSAIVLGLVIVVLGLFLRATRGAAPARFAVAVAMIAAAVAALLFVPRRRRTDPSPPVSLTRASEYVTSSACRSCHPSEYASWHDSYHRTMTQVATGDTVLAPLVLPATFNLDGKSYGMRRLGDAIWATLPGDEAGVDRRVRMTTGSHHYQAYWVEGDRDGELQLFPFVYLLGQSARWIPRREAFVEPPDAELAPPRWESNCIQCHATAGRPGTGKGAEVAELGIACEACHGAGGAHVEKYQDPVERYRAHATDRPDATLVNPSRLSAERASMICGTCHAFTFPRDEADFWESGYTRSYRPGQSLNASRVLLTAEELAKPGSPTLDTDAGNLFYDDGTVRIGGREYNGMVLSACFLRGEGKRKLSCLSCHSMHDSDPDDQLTHGREGDIACAACHPSERYASASHTHHEPSSLGSSCVGCHMPKTAYALLKSIRSHRIDSPDAKTFGMSDRPNACNLCHVDRSLAWTASRLEEWFGQAGPSRAPEAETPAGAAWLLAGDPGQRSIAAAAMGELGARTAAGDEWEAGLLASADRDPYAAVRFIVSRSLHQVHPASEPPEPFHPKLVDGLIAARSTRALTLSE